MKVYQIKIELKDFEPLIWRRVLIPSGITFDMLHRTIQIAMGWLDYHLYIYEMSDMKLKIVCNEQCYFDWKDLCREYKEKQEKGEPAEYLSDMADLKLKKSWNTKIDKYLKECGSFDYEYDFGDSWYHRITLERVGKCDDIYCPIVLEGEGSCPPEDVGGTGGYEHFLAVLKNKKHSEHEMMRKWGLGQLYRPFNLEATNYTMTYALRMGEEAEF